MLGSDLIEAAIGRIEAEQPVVVARRASASLSG
jgi:hypothetical protein